MNIMKIASSAGLLASLLCLGACTVAADDGATNDRDDKVSVDGKTGTASEAYAEAPHACSWAEMDTAQSACDQAHGWVGRTFVGCTITSCVATSTTVYYSYTTAL